MKIIQFLPYFPPHKWWLETVAEEFSSNFVKYWYWEVVNMVFDKDQNQKILDKKLGKINYLHYFIKIF